MIKVARMAEDCISSLRRSKRPPVLSEQQRNARRHEAKEKAISRPPREGIVTRPPPLPPKPEGYQSRTPTPRTGRSSGSSPACFEADLSAREISPTTRDPWIKRETLESPLTARIVSPASEGRQRYPDSPPFDPADKRDARVLSPSPDLLTPPGSPDREEASTAAKETGGFWLQVPAAGDSQQPDESEDVIRKGSVNFSRPIPAPSPSLTSTQLMGPPPSPGSIAGSVWGETYAQVPLTPGAASIAGNSMVGTIHVCLASDDIAVDLPSIPERDEEGLECNVDTNVSPLASMQPLPSGPNTEAVKYPNEMIADHHHDRPPPLSLKASNKTERKRKSSSVHASPSSSTYTGRQATPQTVTSTARNTKVPVSWYQREGQPPVTPGSLLGQEYVTITSSSSHDPMSLPISTTTTGKHVAFMAQSSPTAASDESSPKQQSPSASKQMSPRSKYNKQLPRPPLEETTEVSGSARGSHKELIAPDKSNDAGGLVGSEVAIRQEPPAGGKKEKGRKNEPNPKPKQHVLNSIPRRAVSKKANSTVRRPRKARKSGSPTTFRPPAPWNTALPVRDETKMGPRGDRKSEASIMSLLDIYLALHCGSVSKEKLPRLEESVKLPEPLVLHKGTPVKLSSGAPLIFDRVVCKAALKRQKISYFEGGDKKMRYDKMHREKKKEAGI